jgi:hypothetical protein
VVRRRAANRCRTSRPIEPGTALAAAPETATVDAVAAERLCAWFRALAVVTAAARVASGKDIDRLLVLAP